MRVRRLRVQLANTRQELAAVRDARALITARLHPSRDDLYGERTRRIVVHLITEENELAAHEDDLAAELADLVAGRRCDVCDVWTFNPDHVCTVYDGPPCGTCGEGTVTATLGAPAYGKIQVCRQGHSVELTPCGIFTLDQTR